MTELLGMCTANPPKKRKIGSSGIPLDVAEVKIFDDNDKELPPGKVGELVVKSPCLLKGYHNRPDADKEAFRNGWFHTGDLGYRDEDNYFFIVDRKKHIIIKGGENISPKAVEDVLNKHPAVNEAAVLGIPDKIYGEEVKAFIVLNKGKKASEEELIAHCKKHLHSFQCPKYVEFTAEIPKTPSGKVMKRKLLEN